MLHGLYLSAQGANAQSTRLEVISNNLANASTTGFKRDLARFQAHLPFDAVEGSPSNMPPRAEQATGGVALFDVSTDFSNGPMLETGNPLDVAITGNGFFRVSNGRQEYLTRNGAFTLSATGELMAEGGRVSVLSADGNRIVVPSDATRVDIAGDGTISAIGPEGGRAVLGRIDVVRPASPQHVDKIGHTLYRSRGRLAPVGPEVQTRQGFREGSGSNPVTEMMQMIEASRSFEMNMSMLRYQDESLGRLLSSMARR